MTIVTIDFETYYSQEYSLTRMSEVDYILNPLFQVIMCAIKVGAEPADICIGHAAVAARLGDIGSAIGWDRVALCSHNMRFDGSIAAWHFNVRPKLYLCTLSMARALTHIKAGGSSLDKVSTYLGLPAKGTEVAIAKGKRLEDFGTAIISYAAYCLRDCENCYSIFQILKSRFPSSEIHVADTTARMFIEPQVKLDSAKLVGHLADVRAARAVAFERVAHIDPAAFSSNQKFAALLEGHGVDVPMKTSPTTGEDIPALAKADRGFKELCDDDTQPIEVQALLAARIGAKSTLEETRTLALLGLSHRQWGNDRAWCPVPLKYYGAHTGRHSGDGGFNFLNFKRGSPIRGAIVAPPGMRIVHRDASQIEARMVAWLARCMKLLTAFEEGRDVYCEFASTVYGRPITKANTLERFAGGKTPILGLGYGMGPPRFRHTLFIGNGGISVPVDLEWAEKVVTLYRREYCEIPILWQLGAAILNRMIHGAKPIPLIPAITYTADCLWLPNGMPIQYPGLRHEVVNHSNGVVGTEIVYDGGKGRGRTKLFGGKVIENISQALARIVVTDIATRVLRATDYHPFLTTYDSLDYCVPEADAAALDAHLDAAFVVRPGWAPELPLASEGGWGCTLLDAERRVNT